MTGLFTKTARFGVVAVGAIVALLALCHAVQAQVPAPYPLAVQWEDEEAPPAPDTYEYEEQRPEARRRSKQALPLGDRLSRAPAQKKPSAIEEMYRQRVVSDLEQFGYDMFGVPSAETRETLNRLADTHVPPSGAVGDDFRLGFGDEVEVVFSGQRNDRGFYTINNEGKLIIDDLPPIPAAGRKMAQVRWSLQTAAQNLHNTEAYISLSKVRQIGVLVVGHVQRPGRQTMTVFHTVLDALMAAGGVQKSGSLRQIKLVRGGRSTHIDLYGLLLQGSTNMDLRLEDGDRLIVPSIGPTVAVAGEAKRTGIFEILSDLKGMYHKPAERSQKISLNDMLDFGGGVLSPGRNRFLKLSVTPEGREEVSDLSEDQAFEPLFGDGSILMISKGQEKRAGMVELTGHTLRPGMHALDHNPALSDVLSSPDVLGPDIYPLAGVIERWDEEQMARRMISFPLRLVLKGDYDRKLEDGDVVRLFSLEAIRALEEKAIVQQKDDQQGSRPPPDTEEDMERRIDDQALAAFLRERSAFVRGAVRKPGAYPVSEGVTLENLIAVAGGLALEAHTGNIEISRAAGGPQSGQREQVDFRVTRPRDVMVRAGDSVRINQKFKKIKDQSVLVIGEVRNPGRYDLMPGDRVSDLLERAGGLTAQAYAEGAIFSRESERRAEEMRFRSHARNLKQAIANALEMDDKKVNAGKIAEARALAKELEDAEGVGRITIEADPGALAAQPELDMLLESGDRLYVPRRNLAVRVRGEVLSPSTLQFREGKDPRDYIDEAGGFSFHADKSRTFVVYPDGSAQPLSVSAWNHRDTFIPPGSTIIVPRDPEPFDFVESAKDISQILSNLAITAIFIDDVRDDN